MRWNWQQEEWPHVCYDLSRLEEAESVFLRQSGLAEGVFRHLGPADRELLLMELLADEGVRSAEIEGEYLDRESVRSSLRRNFGLTSGPDATPPEQGMADLMTAMYRDFKQPLTDETLCRWNRMLTGHLPALETGRYRTHPEPMQVVSSRLDAPRIHFEAPPSTRVPEEMRFFVDWFNATVRGGTLPLPALTRAGLTHLHFVSIHPFEGGNGRIARALAGMALSQDCGFPLLTSLSTIIRNRRREYYAQLEANNKALEITNWLVWFAAVLLEAVQEAGTHMDFLLAKTALCDRLRGRLNPRQEKALARVLREGPGGFSGGLSAENYIAITGASRATTTRDLQELLAMGAFTRTGKLKGTRYHLLLEHRTRE
jgi:Fic family protein